MNQATNLSPAGVPNVFGRIARSAAGTDRRQRRAGVALMLFIAIPFLVIAVGAVIAIAYH